jgi:CheY-like chemotaxis protein
MITSQQHHPSLKGLRILVVEDTGIVAREVKFLLEHLGCEVVGPEPNLAKGLRAAETAELDGALLDVNLKGEQSYPIAEELMCRDIPFIFVTGYGSAHLDENFRLFPTLEKPFGMGELTAAIEQAICRRETLNRPCGR